MKMTFQGVVSPTAGSDVPLTAIVPALTHSIETEVDSRLGVILRGSVSITNSSQGTAVVFPLGTFTSTPYVYLENVAGSTGPAWINFVSQSYFTASWRTPGNPTQGPGVYVWTAYGRNDSKRDL